MWFTHLSFEIDQTQKMPTTMDSGYFFFFFFILKAHVFTPARRQQHLSSWEAEKYSVGAQSKVKPKRGEKLPLYCSPSETSSWELLASFQIKNKT